MGAAASFQKLREDMEAPSSIDSTAETGIKLPAAVQGTLSFRNITFAYVSRPDQPVLKDVSFDCPAGKHTALVGLSGSGKSTIAGLAVRLYDPTEGNVSLDGHDLRDLNVKNLRSYMSLVQQEPSLLDRSILENIALGLLNSPQPSHGIFQASILGGALSQIAAEVREGKKLDNVLLQHGSDAASLVKLVQEAAVQADAASFINKLEHGYGTMVGTGGKLVSGGQRQRIALARALIRDPRILILDEATASLDSASEQRIQEAIDRVAKDRTVVAIAHRLSTIKNADNIIVMNQGIIIEQGTHTELMALNGSYASMVRLQNIEQEREDTPSLSSTVRPDNDMAIAEVATLDKKAANTRDQHDVAQDGTSIEDTTDQVEAELKLDSDKPGWVVTKSLVRMARPNLAWLILALFAGLVVGGTFSASGLIFGHTIGYVSPCNPLNDILWAGRFFGGLFFMLAVIEFLAYTISWSGFGYVAEKLLYRIRVLCFRALYEQTLDWHQSAGRTPSSLLSVITADAAAVGGFSGSVMGTMYSVSINFVIAIILSHILAWKIAIVCLVTVPLLLGSGVMQLRSLSQFERKHAGAYSQAIGISVEAVTSFKTVSSLSLEQEILESYRRALRGPQKEMAMASAYTNFWLAIANSTGNLVYAFAYWWGSTRITKGEYTPTQFFIILVAMLVSAQLWGQMFALAPEVTRARAAASRILSLMDLGSANTVPPRDADLVESSVEEKDIEAVAESVPKRSTENRGSTVTFRDVAFSYPARPQIQILQSTSFTIQAGQFCGLVGPSGAGKSTIMSLVQRMYQPASGTIEIDGVNICGREGAQFRNEIAVVPQDCALFDGTIRFNVGLGSVPGREATEAEIHEACQLANIHDTIMALPDGYDTECGPNGSRLSGGQRQRLAIARALVRKPRLLLLDESTSALDAESERMLQEGLERAAKGITVIAITHRLHTVRKADVIFVVEGGKIVDKGRHEELVERSESYRVNALQQMLGS
ncbi:Leptomycin B resistance protein-like protein [Paramyrothecium foliicola]|nr:Leptomycin B resistance protein-like protein [Paramyrothecium foliicola]